MTEFNFKAQTIVVCALCLRGRFCREAVLLDEVHLICGITPDLPRLAGFLDRIFNIRGLGKTTLNIHIHNLKLRLVIKTLFHIVRQMLIHFLQIYKTFRKETISQHYQNSLGTQIALTQRVKPKSK